MSEAQAIASGLKANQEKLDIEPVVRYGVSQIRYTDAFAYEDSGLHQAGAAEGCPPQAE